MLPATWHVESATGLKYLKIILKRRHAQGRRFPKCPILLTPAVMAL